MKRIRFSQGLLVTVLLLPQFSVAAPGHAHGQARLDVAQDKARLEVSFDSPLESLIGFEHAPRNARERALLGKALATLRAPQPLLEFSAAAGCRLEQAVFEGPGVKADGTLAAAAAATSAAAAANPHEAGHGRDHPPKGREAHADLTVSWRYSCNAPAELKSATVRLFEAFPRMSRLDIQVASPGGQHAARMTARGSERTFAINR